MHISEISVQDLVIDRFTVLINYDIPVPASTLEVQGRPVVGQVLDHIAKLSLTPAPSAQYSDSTWTVEWDPNSQRGFRLNISKDVVAFQSLGSANWQADLEIAQQATIGAIQAFQIQRLRAISCRIEQAFLLSSPSDNRELLRESIWTGIDQSPIAELFKQTSDIERFDVQVHTRLNDDLVQVLNLQLPGNEEYGTVWTTYTVRTDEERQYPTKLTAVQGVFDGFREAMIHRYYALLCKCLETADVQYYIQRERR